MFSKIRPLYEQFSIPFGKVSLRLGLTPNFWTLFSLLSAAIAGVFLAQGKFILGLVLCIVMNIADMLDGATARAGNMGTRFGTVLDHCCDRYGEFFLIGGLSVGNWISPATAMFTASGIIMASYVRAKAESSGGMKSCIAGFAGRQEKLILLWTAMILFALNINYPAEIIVFLTGLISHITAVQRLLFAKKEILG